jgi:hypothetical protein
MPGDDMSTKGSPTSHSSYKIGFVLYVALQLIDEPGALEVLLSARNYQKYLIALAFPSEQMSHEWDTCSIANPGELTAS